MDWITLDAFAKVNLGLAVLSRRPDGYHDIETIFQSVSLCDRLRIAGPTDRTTIRVSGVGVRSADVPSDDRNLAVRAALALRELTGCPHVTIELEKRIPVAAGLGGGSSDAAAVLVGLNELFRLGRPRPELAELALEVGSDVPFFIHGGTARGTGRGERLEPLSSLRAWFVLVTPDVAVTAAQGYALARIGLTASTDLIRLSCSAIQEGDLGRLAASLVNDLEAGVVSCCPDVAVARSALEEAGAAGAIMSGSGPTVLGLAPDGRRAHDIRSRLEGRGFQIAVAETTGTGSRITGSGTS